ncbi:MAG: methenyltetrahydromethanopterin cyclohydrolase [Planctomycetota bacterium]|nr:methenyltetrahydromethanopterin cyclohydrolase [Planctomycetota bacterium]
MPPFDDTLHPPGGLNDRARALVDECYYDRQRLRIGATFTLDGPLILDFGINAPGGLEAGLRLAEICLSGHGSVKVLPADRTLWNGAAISVMTDNPVVACMQSQYAGWKISGDKFFAMGSGAMRAAAGKEELFEQIGGRETAEVAVGVLETRTVPSEEICANVAKDCRIEVAELALAVAPTASQAGTVQIVARSVETALHKLFELGFDLSRIESAFGTAPLPPVAKNDLAAIGRTNDAILYGGEVTLWVRGDDDSLAEIAPKAVSAASSDHGALFAELFKRYDHDFYKMDPLLFSPAVVQLCNLDTGRTFQAGRLMPELIQRSFVN